MGRRDGRQRALLLCRRQGAEEIAQTPATIRVTSPGVQQPVAVVCPRLVLRRPPPLPPALPEGHTAAARAAAAGPMAPAASPLQPCRCFRRTSDRAGRTCVLCCERARGRRVPSRAQRPAHVHSKLTRRGVQAMGRERRRWLGLSVAAVSSSGAAENAPRPLIRVSPLERRPHLVNLARAGLERRAARLEEILAVSVQEQERRLHARWMRGKRARRMAQLSLSVPRRMHRTHVWLSTMLSRAGDGGKRPKGRIR